MENVKVKITRTAVTAMYGTLSAGDILLTSVEFAKHLVEDCNAAEYVSIESPQQDEMASDKKVKKSKV